MRHSPGYFLTAGLLTGVSVASLAFLTNGRALSNAFAIVSCSSSSACSGGSNTSTGPGVEGISAKGNGVLGEAKFNSTNHSNGQPAVLGEDLSTSGTYDTGVIGTSTRGTGVSGTSSSGIGVNAKSSKNYGLKATSSNGYGIYGTGYGGMYGYATGNGGGGNGVAGTATGSGNNGVYGYADTGYGGYFIGAQGGVYSSMTTAGFAGEFHGSGNSAVYASGTNANYGIEATSDTNNGIFASTSAGVDGPAAAEFESQGTALYSFGNNVGVLAITDSGTSNYALYAIDNGSTPLFAVDGDGDVQYHGTLSQFSRVKGVGTIESYATANTAPRIQDSGTAQLVYGAATVRLNRAFAASIDTSTPYQVVLTPDADTRGLYVARKTATEFTVRELQGGRSSLSFDYQISARQAGHAADTMVVLPPGQRIGPAIHVHHDRRHSGHAPEHLPLPKA
jgi:hypothetical protein